MQHNPVKVHVQLASKVCVCLSPQEMNQKTVKLNICTVWTPKSAYFRVWSSKLSKLHSLCSCPCIHTEHFMTDYTSCPIYLDWACLSTGILVSTVLVAAGSNRWFWLFHALLVIVIVTIITFLISETVELIVVVIACLVVECVPFLVLPWLSVVSDNM